MKNALIVLFCVFVLSSCSSYSTRMDISGEWSVRLDSTDVGIKEKWQGSLFDTRMILPGTTDGAKLGIPCSLEPVLQKPQLLHLTRKYSYIGPAWYTREIKIPSDWDGKDYVLHLERVLWDTQVWVDSQKVEGHEESLTTPHIYDLTPYLQCGKNHILTIRVDNRKRHDISVNELAHAYTEDTQVKWNGILGKMYIEAVEKTVVENIQIYPNAVNRTIKAVLSLKNGFQDEQVASLSLSVSGSEDGVSYDIEKREVKLLPGRQQVEVTCKLGENAPLWSEFTPYIYKAVATLDSEGKISEKETTFGLRDLKRNGTRLMLNDKPLFLRGTLECCIFPLTGTPPMDKQGWRKVFESARAYGMNHLRFHSWCPPEAAFQVADEMGFYLQVELPVWSVTLGKDKPTIDFLRKEAHRISMTYGNHPSFCFWSLGNELQSDFEVMGNMLSEIKKMDNRHLYTTTSFTFEKEHGVWPEVNDDYFVTQWTKKGWVRGQGVFNQKFPSFDKDFRKSIEGMEVPLITHEVGQYSVYPDLAEIDKYTGTLMPLNFMAVKNDLQKKGLLEKAPAYLQASGELAAILYKEEVERALKTPGISGFQLLDLHDFPGQGTALVGLLNAFWDSKGIISDKEFREFCSPVVPLLRFPKAVYTNNETFKAQIELCNYGEKELTDCNLIWTISVGGQTVKKEMVPVKKLTFGHNGKLGLIDYPLSTIVKAEKIEISLAVEGTEYRNRWNIWVYPNENKLAWGDVKYTRNYSEALNLLGKGEKVLFNPDWHTMKGIEGKFVPVFWSPVHFPNQAGTMGVLCNPQHPALAEFPTDMHTDWQWWDLNINSTTMVADSIQGGTPIVEMVDNFVNNRRLASLYEGTVGKGKLMLATFDLQSDLEKRPVARQMLHSLLNYMNSNQFNPSEMNGLEKMKEIFGTANNEKRSFNGVY